MKAGNPATGTVHAIISAAFGHGFLQHPPPGRCDPVPPDPSLRYVPSQIRPVFPTPAQAQKKIEKDAVDTVRTCKNQHGMIIDHFEVRSEGLDTVLL